MVTKLVANGLVARICSQNCKVWSIFVAYTITIFGICSYLLIWIMEREREREIKIKRGRERDRQRQR